MTRSYHPKAGEAVTVRLWHVASTGPDAVRRLLAEHDGTVLEADGPRFQLQGSERVFIVGTEESSKPAEPWERYTVTEVSPQPRELIGRRVRIRRYVVSGIPQARELDADVEGTVTGLYGPRVLELDPASAVVRYASEGHDVAEPFGAAWRIGLDYVHLGGSVKDGSTAYLITEVEPDPEPASLDEAPAVTRPGHLFDGRELLNVTRLALDALYRAPEGTGSAQVREAARQALARLEGRTEL